MPIHLKNSKFHIHYVLDPNFDMLAPCVCSKTHVHKKILQDWFLIYSRKSVFKIVVVVVVVFVQFRRAYLKKQK